MDITPTVYLTMYLCDKLSNGIFGSSKNKDTPLNGKKLY